MTTRAVLAAALALGGLVGAADEGVLELAEGENHLVLESGVPRDVRVAIPAAGRLTLQVANFSSTPCSWTPRAKNPTTFELVPNFSEYNVGLDDVRVSAVDFRVEGAGELWLYLVRASDADAHVDAARSRAAYVARAEHHERVAQDFERDGSKEDALERRIWAASDLSLARCEGRALAALKSLVVPCAGTRFEAEVLNGVMDMHALFGHRDLARESAEALLAVVAKPSSTDEWQRRYNALVCLATTTDDRPATLSAATEAFKILGEVSDPRALPGFGLDSLLVIGEALAEVSQRDERWALACAYGTECADPRVVRPAFERAFERARQSGDVDHAERVLEHLQSLQLGPSHEIDDMGRAATLAATRGDRWGEVQHLTAAARRAREVGDVSREAGLMSMHGRALARLGFAVQGRDLARAAVELTDGLDDRDIGYAALRAAGVFFAEFLGRRPLDADDVRWSQEWRTTLDLYERALAVAEDVGEPEMIDELQYFLAVHHSLVPERAAEARALATSALASAFERHDHVAIAVMQKLLVELDLERGVPPAELRAPALLALTHADMSGRPMTKISARAIVARVALAMDDLEEVERQRAVVETLVPQSLRGAQNVDDVSRRLARGELAEWAYIDQDRIAAHLAHGETSADVIDEGLRIADRWSLLGTSDVQTPAAPRDLTDTLPEDLVVVRYANGFDALYAYVVTRHGIEHHRVGDAAELQQRVLNYRRGLSDVGHLHDIATVERDGHALWRDLVAAVVEPALLERCRSLIVVPTPWLAHLPFEALVHEASRDAQTFADVPFVLTQFDVHYASAVATVLGGVDGPVNTRSMLVAAAPDYGAEAAKWRYGTDTLTDLPHTRDEAQAIKQLGGARVHLRLGERATRAAMLGELVDYDVLHFAVHGSAGDDPRSAGLAFTDGILSAEDIRALKLSTSLVVLSACDTAAGLERMSQRVDSLANAFTSAGARGVVATLWRVQDATTAALMSSFYEGYLEGGQGAGEALTRARRHVLESSVADLVASLGGTRSVEVGGTRGGRVRGRRTTIADGHPYLWSSFVYTGSIGAAP